MSWTSETNIKGPKGDKGDKGDPGTSGSGSGDVVGPAGAVADRIAVYNGTTGKIIKDGGKLISDLALVSHTHTASQVTDFAEAVDDRASALIQNGTGITWAYNDAANTLTPTVTVTAVPPATVAPIMDGTAAVGSTTKYAREDHIHPTDTSRAAATAIIWDAATASSVTLSGGNLVATSTGGSTDHGAHVAGASGKTTGKYYFEVTVTTSAGGGDTCIGIGTTAATYANLGGGGGMNGVISYSSSGNVWANGSSVGPSIGAHSSGSIVGVAVDLDNRKVWFRKSPAGSWNGGAFDPAANTGGVTIPAGTMIPFAVFNASGNIFTANFGASAFAGTAPSGFTAGWMADPPAGTVRYDAAQGLTANQMSQGRANIAVTKRNYIINGGMQISQENGTTVGATSGYHPVDMFSVGIASTGTIGAVQVLGSPNRLRVAIGTLDTSIAATEALYIRHSLEGLRVADLRFGSAAAKTVTIQFGVKAPAGTYCVALMNLAANRSYIAEYVITAGEANTDVVKSVTITGCTDGTWLTDNGTGFYLTWSLMMGANFQTTSGTWVTTTSYATTNQFNFMSQNAQVFELFDVSLTEGSVAPPFQLPDYAAELTLCQRYWRKSYDISVNPGTVAVNGQAVNYGDALTSATHTTYGTISGLAMRSAPTVTLFSPATGAAARVRDVFNNADLSNCAGNNQSSAGFTWYGVTTVASVSVYITAQWTANARL